MPKKYLEKLITSLVQIQYGNTNNSCYFWLIMTNFQMKKLIFFKGSHQYKKKEKLKLLRLKVDFIYPKIFKTFSTNDVYNRPWIRDVSNKTWIQYWFSLHTRYFTLLLTHNINFINYLNWNLCFFLSKRIVIIY